MMLKLVHSKNIATFGYEEHGKLLRISIVSSSNRGIEMKRKIITALVCVGAWLLCEGVISPEMMKAMSHDKSRVIGETKGAKAKEILRVVDQDGVPVMNARIYGSFWPGDNGRKYILVYGLTNIDGVYIAEGVSKWKFTYQVTKDGYYMSNGVIDYLAATNVPVVASGKWQPYGTTRNVILKKIKNPVPLVHSKSSNPKPPSFDEWYGYDIERRQWVKPFGNGVHSDMLIKISIDAKNKINDFKAVMEVSFTNNPHAGAYVMKKDDFSEMKSVYEADTNASYQSSFKFIHEKRAIIGQTPFSRYVSGAQKIDTRLDDNSYIVFRTRTKVDNNGNLVSSHYGKIYGLWQFFGRMCAANVQFNPTPNDPNLEDEETAKHSQLCSRQREEQMVRE